MTNRYEITCLDRSAPISGERLDNHPYPAVREFARRNEDQLPGDGPWRFRVVEYQYRGGDPVPTDPTGETTWTVERRSIPTLVCSEVE